MGAGSCNIIFRGHDMVETVVFDFDGVIHSYTSGWQGPGVIPDPPVPGIKEALKILQDIGYRIIIISSRSRYPEGVLAMTEYLEKHQIPYNEIDSEKPPAVAYVDDRAVRFDGNCDAMIKSIQCEQVWYKEKPVCLHCSFSEPAAFPEVFCNKKQIRVYRQKVACPSFYQETGNPASF